MPKYKSGKRVKFTHEKDGPITLVYSEDKEQIGHIQSVEFTPTQEIAPKLRIGTVNYQPKGKRAVAGTITFFGIEKPLDHTYNCHLPDGGILEGVQLLEDSGNPSTFVCMEAEAPEDYEPETDHPLPQEQPELHWKPISEIVKTDGLYIVRNARYGSISTRLCVVEKGRAAQDNDYEEPEYWGPIELMVNA